MRRPWLLLFLCVWGIPRTTLAQHAFDDLPIDDPSRRSILAAGEDATKKIRDNIFVVARVDHAECYPGQQILLSYRLYTALQSTSSVTAKPILNGFTVKERKLNEAPLPDKTIDGRRYHGFVVWQALLTPLQTGEYTIDPLTVGNDVRYTGADGKPGHYAGVVISRKTTIHVGPLPAIGKPPSYNGLVGKWQIRSRLATPRPDSTGSDTLFVEIAGAGSFDNIGMPYLRWPAGLRHIEPIQRWEINDTAAPQTGKKIFAIPFTTAAAGEYVLPPMELAWFDPAAEKYHISKTDSLTVHATGNAAAAPPVAATPTATPAVAPPADESFITPMVILLGLLAVLILLFVILRTRRRRAVVAVPAPAAYTAAASPAPAITPPPSPEPIQPPTEERQLADIKQTLLQFLQTRLQTEAWAEEDILQLLQKKDPSLTEKVSPLLEQCNKLLYSPHRPDPGVLTSLNRQLEEVLKQ